MTARAICPGCSRAFVFDTDAAPAQRVESKRRRSTGKIVAYYPACPNCRRAVEVENPEPRLPTSRVPVGRK